MNALKVLWTENELYAVQAAIVDLYRCHGAKMSENSLKETAELFANELSERNLPPKAILAALRQLKFDDIPKVSLFLIEQSARKFIEPVTENRVECDYCYGSGYISMRNDDQNEFALACQCAAGDSYASRGNAKWNGQEFQQGRHGMYRLRFPEILKNDD